MALEDTDDFATYFDQLSRLKPDETPPTNFGGGEPVAIPPVETPVETPAVTDTPVEPLPNEGDQATGAGGDPVDRRASCRERVSSPV